MSPDNHSPNLLDINYKWNVLLSMIKTDSQERSVSPSQYLLVCVCSKRHKVEFMDKHHLVICIPCH